MDMTGLRVLGTVFMAIAFAAVVFWAFGPSRRKYFEDAADLPFKDERDDRENGTDSDQNKRSGEEQ